MCETSEVFLMLNHTDITQNTYVQSRTVTEIMAREKCGRHGCRNTIRRPWRHTCPMHLPDQLDMLIQWSWRVGYSELVTCEVQTCLLFFSYVEYSDMHIVYGFCDGNACTAVQEYQRRFPDRRIPSRSVFTRFTRHCVILVLFRVFLCSLKGRWYERLTHERTFFRWFREVRVCPLVEWPLASAYHVCRCGGLYMRKICILTMIKGYNIWNQATMFNVWICATG